MSSNKKDNNGWILCPSKSFPGKFYYFNVLNGEAAWSLNDADQKTLQNNKVLQKAETSHTYPEPSSPPFESPTTKIGVGIQRTVTNVTKPFTNVPQTTQMFGQAKFPTYISNVEPYMQNIVWMPMVLPKPKTDHGTQTCEFDRDIFVQTCNIPLSQRFSKYDEPKNCPSSFTSGGYVTQNNYQSLKCFAKNPTVRVMTNTELFGPKQHSNSLTIEWGKTQSKSDNFVSAFCTKDVKGVKETQPFNPIAQSKDNDILQPPQKFERQRTWSQSDSVIIENPAKYDQSKLIFYSNFKTQTELPTKSGCILRKSVFDPDNKVYNSIADLKNTSHMEKEKKNNTESSLWCYRDKKIIKNDKMGSLLGNVDKNDPKENTEGDLLDKLDKNDLRYTIERKRRKSVDLGCLNFEGNHFQCSNTQKEVTKKRVTFDLDSSDASNEDKQEVDRNQPRHVTIHTLRRLAVAVSAHWWIVVDTSVLLRDYEFIEKFVQLDRACKLMIPRAVWTEINEYCFGDCRGQARVVAARQLARKLASPPSHVLVQSMEKEDEMFTKMSTLGRILNCCMQIIQNDDHMVLITDDQTLYENAIALKLHCYKLKDIKDGASKPETAVPEAVKVTLENETKQNLFLQKCFPPFPNQQCKVALDCTKKTFTKDINKKTCDAQTDAKTTTDANTSPMRFEEKIVDEKGHNDSFDFDVESDTTIISKTMEKLVIKDKKVNCNNEKQKSIKKQCDGSRNSFVFQIKNNKNKISQDDQLQTKNKNQSVQKTVVGVKMSIQDKLEPYRVTSDLMEKNIRCNIEEWICTFGQILEHALSAVLQPKWRQSPTALPPPWTLHEAVTTLKQLFRTADIVSMSDDLLLLLVNNSSKNGELNRNIQPDEFMKIFGYGVLLIETLQTTENSPCLSEVQQLLRDMLAEMRNGKREVQLGGTPAPRPGGTEPRRRNFMKKSSDIIQYLKKQFPAWSSHPDTCESANEMPQNDTKVVRTFGRNLNLLTIDKTKSLTLKETKDKSEEVKENSNIKKQNSEINISENTLLNSQSTVKLYEKAEPKVIRLFDTSTPFPKRNITKDIANDISLTPTHGNTFGGEEKDGPKVIRNIKLIDAFEEKLKSKFEDCTQIDDTLSTLTDASDCTIIDLTNNDEFVNDKVNDKDCSISNNDKISFNDNQNLKRDTEQNNDSLKPNDSSTNDSGFENEYDTYAFLQIFLSELSGSMKSIYKFIDDSITELRNEHLLSEKRKTIYEKATVTHGHLAGIIYKLECIAQREADGMTPLKEIILKADVVVVSDKRMVKYRQLVMKCVEQAQLLEGALRALLAICNGNYDVIFGSERPAFLNIYE